MTKLPAFASRAPAVADEAPLRRELVFVVPGRLDQLTGGYLFDRHIVEGLRARGRVVRVIELTGGRPKANAAVLAEFDYRNLDELAEFRGRNTTREFLACPVHKRLVRRIKEGALRSQAITSLRVVLRANPVAWSAYDAPLG